VYPNTLAEILGVESSYVPVDQVLQAVRLACGATLEAARWALKNKGPALNLMGGFHHAGPDFGSGLCPLNDVACAVAVLRREGFFGQVLVVDLDAHRPDGTAACLREFKKVKILSLGPFDGQSAALPGVYTYSVIEGAGNARYKRVFDSMLESLPQAELAFVIAGGDVLKGDKFGRLGLDLAGARRRDLSLARKLSGLPCVWLPGGGYHQDSWKVLAGTGLVLMEGSTEPISADYDPLKVRYARLSDSIEVQISADDLVEALRMPHSDKMAMLGFYTREAIEYTLFKFGVFPHIERMGYSHLRMDIDRDPTGDRLRIYGNADDQEHLLIECVLATQIVAGVEMLYIHWLTLRNPRARFEVHKKRLPGQDVPGLGLAREAGEMFIRIALRLKLGGVAYRPAWFHTAYAGRHSLRFVKAEHQGRFEALLRDLKGMTLLDATQALADGRITMNKEPYTWESAEMAYWLTDAPEDQELIEKEKQRVVFALDPQ
jgi:hypothetical protein